MQDFVSYDETDDYNVEGLAPSYMGKYVYRSEDCWDHSLYQKLRLLHNCQDVSEFVLIVIDARQKELVFVYVPPLRTGSVHNPVRTSFFSHRNMH